MVIPAVQVAFALSQLLSHRLAFLKGVLAAIEHDAGLARLGLTEAVLLGVLHGGLLKPVLMERHANGPSGLQSLDLELTQRYAWVSFINNRACSKNPVTQVPPWPAPLTSWT